MQSPIYATCLALLAIFQVIPNGSADNFGGIVFGGHTDDYLKPKPPLYHKPKPPINYKPKPPVYYKPKPPITYKPKPPVYHKPKLPIHYKPKPPIDYKPKPPVYHKPKPPINYKPKPPVYHKPKLPINYKPKPPVYHKPKPQIYYKPKPPVYHKPKPPIHYKPKPPVYHKPKPPIHYKSKLPIKPKLPIHYKLNPQIYHKPKPTVYKKPKKPVLYKPKPKLYKSITKPKTYLKSHGGYGYFPSGFSGKSYGKGYKVSYKPFEPAKPMKTVCPYGWLSYDGKCYLFSREKLGWFQAQMKCQYMGGTLAVVNSAHENAYIKMVAAKYHMKPGVWIGLNNVLFPKSHMWFWGYGQKQCGKFDWCANEPKYGKPHYHCVALWDTYHNKWRVFNCRRHLYYICEINPKTPCKCGY